MGEASTVPFAVVTIAAITSAFTDLWKFKVYNLLTIPLLFSGFLYHGLLGGTPNSPRAYPCSFWCKSGHLVPSHYLG